MYVNICELLFCCCMTVECTGSCSAAGAFLSSRCQIKQVSKSFQHFCCGVQHAFAYVYCHICVEAVDMHYLSTCLNVGVHI